MKFLNLRWKRFSVLWLTMALVVMLLSGCGGTAQPGTPADGPVRVGQTVTVGGCQVQLRGYNTMATYIGNVSDWDNSPVMITTYVYNKTVQPIQVGDYLWDDSLQRWLYSLGGKTEEQYWEAFDQKVNGITEAKQVTVTCDGKKLDCFTVGVNSNNQKENVLSFGDMGGFTIVCNLPKGWETVEVTYTVSGETATFELSPLDIMV